MFGYQNIRKINTFVPKYVRVRVANHFSTCHLALSEIFS